MPKTGSYQNRIEILQGTLDMLVLRALQWGPQHGHGIGQMIRASSEDLLRVEHGSLYPALHRLEDQGWIAAEWRASELKLHGRLNWWREISLVLPQSTSRPTGSAKCGTILQASASK